MTFITRRRIIAVTGLADTGKSVLTTSLINHLQMHQTRRFDLGGDIENLQEVPSSAGEPFPYNQYRQHLGTDHKWPSKTSREYRYRCRFIVKPAGRLSRNYDVELIDLPGERFADTLMLGASYLEWSRRILDALQDDPGDRGLAGGFLQLLEAAAFDAPTILLAYKRLLYRLTVQQRRLVSPSTFLLDVDGRQAADLPEEQLLASRFAGLGPDAEFAPLSAAAAAQHPQVAKLFAENYRSYQKNLVAPFYRSFRYCDRLLILIDVPKILMSGPGLFNDSRAIVQSIVAAACPAGNLLTDIGHLLGDLLWRPKHVQRIFFAAVKADLVCRDDHDHLEQLLRQLLSGITQSLRGIECDYGAVSAAVSTTNLSMQSGRPRLRGRLMFNGEVRNGWRDDSEQEFDVPRLPDEWPDNWDGAEYRFPQVYPVISPLIINPPRQTGLDRALRFLLR